MLLEHTSTICHTLSMDTSFFAGNRKRLIDELKGGVVVLGAHTKVQGAADAAAAFRQEANFWWLTGIEAPDWWVIIDGFSSKSWLVRPEVEEAHQLFDGSLSVEQARARSGVQTVISEDEAKDVLRKFARTHRLAYSLGDPSYAKYVDFTLNPAPKRLWKMLERIFVSVQDCRKELSRLRAIKQPAEIEAIQKAAKLTVEAFEHAKQRIATSKYEYEVMAEMTYQFQRSGADHAFEPIVASGTNACTLHYVQNDSLLAKRQLLLIDAGATFGGYSGDVTRTFAVGEPTKRQAAVHKAVQDTLVQIVSLLGPHLTLNEYSREVDGIMKEALIALGLIRNKDDDDGFRRYFPHAISHGLGVDVHDSLGGYRDFRSGMVITVEPGIYIPEEGIGVRIEDNIVITENGHRNITGSLSTDL